MTTTVEKYLAYSIKIIVKGNKSNKIAKRLQQCQIYNVKYVIILR